MPFCFIVIETKEQRTNLVLFCIYSNFKKTKRNFQQPEACYFLILITQCPSILFDPCLCVITTDFEGALCLLLFTKTFPWMCIALISFVRESSEEWEMKKQVLSVTFLDTPDCSVRWDISSQNKRLHSVQQVL